MPHQSHPDDHNHHQPEQRRRQNRRPRPDRHRNSPLRNVWDSDQSSRSPTLPPAPLRIRTFIPSTGNEPRLFSSSPESDIISVNMTDTLHWQYWQYHWQNPFIFQPPPCPGFLRQTGWVYILDPERDGSYGKAGSRHNCINCRIPKTDEHIECTACDVVMCLDCGLPWLRMQTYR